MSDFQVVKGFEDVWRAPSQPLRRTAKAILSPNPRAGEVRARLARIVARVPEVMVKVTGKTSDAAHLRAHLDYIGRNGDLDLEDQDGCRLVRRGEVRDLVDDWSAASPMGRSRAGAPLSRSVVLSMPAQTDPILLRDAARAFAREMFAGRFDYVFALHTDAAHPHVHLAVCAQGLGGARLNPKKADLDHWRQSFAQALRDRGVEAEATPRRSRGVTRRAERAPLRKIRERWVAGRGEIARVQRSAYRDAAKLVADGAAAPPPWEVQLLARQRRIRALYLAQAERLARSTRTEDQTLGLGLRAFVESLPAPETQRRALARALSPSIPKDRTRER